MRHTNDIRKIKQFCSAYTEIAAAYLFGSSATGKDRRKSDIDLAIMVNLKIRAMERVETEDWSMRPPRKSAFGRKFTPERRISTAHSCTAKSNRSPRMVDVELISRKRSRLQGYMDELKAATDTTWEKYRSDLRTKAFVERFLHLAIEEVMRVARSGRKNPSFPAAVNRLIKTKEAAGINHFS